MYLETTGGVMDSLESKPVAEESPDVALIMATGEGDHRAFERFVTRYQNRIYNFITGYIGDRYAAEDLTQEVFLRVYGSSQRFRPVSKVSTWVFRIAYNLCMNEIRRRIRARDFHKNYRQWNEDFAVPSGSDPIERLEIEKILNTALGDLPERQRAALLLRVNEGLSYAEIGSVLSVSIPSVESLLFRARQSLKRKLDRRDKADSEVPRNLLE
jgi:RNA polymerase sigma-70 factor (ECF subfamily)